jgi:hypothetical protein
MDLGWNLLFFYAVAGVQNSAIPAATPLSNASVKSLTVNRSPVIIKFAFCILAHSNNY